MLGPTGILVVEDSPDSVVVLANALTRTFPGATLTLAGSILEFRGKLSSLATVDLAVIDLGLPDGNGQDVIEAVRARWPEAQILVYTLFDDDGNLFDALKRGANGYLLKDDPPARLIRALTTIMEGEPPLSPKIARRMLQEFQARTPAPGGAVAVTVEEPAEDVGGRPDDANLTRREVETLTLAAKGLRLPELARHLGVTRSTAATYLKRIYRKLEVNSRAEAALAAARRGLVRIDRGSGG